MGCREGFGSLADGRPFWTGNFSRPDRTEVLLHSPGTRTGGSAHTKARADSCGGAWRATPPALAIRRSDARPGLATSAAEAGPRCSSTIRVTTTGGLDPTTATSCSGALRATPPASDTQSTMGAPSGRQLLRPKSHPSTVLLPRGRKLVAGLAPGAWPGVRMGAHW